MFILFNNNTLNLVEISIGNGGGQGRIEQIHFFHSSLDQQLYSTCSTH
jgi:hypothetical protein